MSDLISRSELIKLFKEHMRTARDFREIIVNIIPTIKNQPTAYDIDKVVEELEEVHEKFCKNVVCGGKSRSELCEYCEEYIMFNKNIKIVKQGGVYDYVCEYKIKDKEIYASCNNKQIASAFCWFNECGDYKYCPYCGKKIKVVDR